MFEQDIVISRRLRDFGPTLVDPRIFLPQSSPAEILAEVKQLCRDSGMSESEIESLEEEGKLAPQPKEIQCPH
jgi:hypothetical protein